MHGRRQRQGGRPSPRRVPFARRPTNRDPLRRQSPKLATQEVNRTRIGRGKIQQVPGQQQQGHPFLNGRVKHPLGRQVRRIDHPLP